MKIVIASDHGGFELKEQIKKYLINNGYDLIDVGTDNNNSVDYPDFGYKAGKYVADGKAERGIVICGSGIGITIAANKVKGIRAAVCHNEEYAQLARSHNDANILGLGGRFLTFEEASKITDVWLNTAFEGGRHQCRVDKLNL